MFCTNCGGKIEDGAKFCSGCGKAVSGAPGESAPATPENSEAKAADIMKDDVLVEWTLQKIFFSYVDAGGRSPAVSELFKAQDFSTSTKGAILEMATGVDFYLKVRLYKNGIIFFRATALGKLTDIKMEIHGKEITSVEVANSFLNRAVTVKTRSRGKFTFEVPKKHRETVVKTLNDMKV